MTLRFLLLALFATLTIGMGEDGFPVESPEHQAMMLASAALADDDFSLRQDYWRGILPGETGRAVKLQFFKRNLYRLYLGVAPTELPPGAKLDLRIYDVDNEEVAAVMGEPDAAAVELEFDNLVGTGLFLVLMRVEIPPGPLLVAEVPAVMFYGWK